MMQIVKITAGRGPKECAWVVTKLLVEFEKFLKKSMASFELMESNISYELVISATYQVSKKVDLTGWIGPVLWIGNSPIRPNHKRKNWFVAIQKFEVKDQLSFDINDVTFHTMRSNGAGGQHVNKTESAVRLVHEPTRVEVVMRINRSQHRNKQMGLTLLQLKLQEMNENSVKNNVQQQWKEGIEIERGNPVRTYVGLKFKLKR